MRQGAQVQNEAASRTGETLIAQALKEAALAALIEEESQPAH